MQDDIIYGDSFEFNEEVTECFDDMIVRSIPDYFTMRSYCQKLGHAILAGKEAPKIVDIGCSTGISACPFVTAYSAKGEFILIDYSESMVDKCKSFYRHFPCNIKIKQQDISREYAETDVDLILSIFTVQFTPISERMKILKSLYNSLNHGGAIILCEKVICDDTVTDDLFKEKYYEIKTDNGYNKQNIESKEQALKTALYPMKFDWNVELLRSAGFKHIDCFWRAWNFVGLVGIKE